MVGYQPAGMVMVEAAASAPHGKLHALAEQTLAVGGRDHAEIGIDQQHARLVVIADAHALDDGAGLRLPVEMDRKHTERLALGLALCTHAGAIGCDLRAS